MCIQRRFQKPVSRLTIATATSHSIKSSTVPADRVFSSFKVTPSCTTRSDFSGHNDRTQFISEHSNRMHRSLISQAMHISCAPTKSHRPRCSRRSHLAPNTTSASVRREFPLLGSQAYNKFQAAAAPHRPKHPHERTSNSGDMPKQIAIQPNRPKQCSNVRGGKGADWCNKGMSDGRTNAWPVLLC